MSLTRMDSQPAVHGNTSPSVKAVVAERERRREQQNGTPRLWNQLIHKKRERQGEVVHAPLLDLFRVAEEEVRKPSLAALSPLLHGLSRLKVMFVPAADGYHRGELYDVAETIPLAVYRKVLGKEPLYTKKVDDREPVAIIDTYEAVFVSLAYNFDWNVVLTKTYESLKRNAGVVWKLAL